MKTLYTCDLHRLTHLILLIREENDDGEIRTHDCLVVIALILYQTIVLA
jgi:hypothetical protein